MALIQQMSCAYHVPVALYSLIYLPLIKALWCGIVVPFSRWENWGSARWSDLPKIQLVRTDRGLAIQVFQLKSTTLFSGSRLFFKWRNKYSISAQLFSTSPRDWPISWTSSISEPEHGAVREYLVQPLRFMHREIETQEGREEWRLAKSSIAYCGQTFLFFYSYWLSTYYVPELL